jgi:hypothetical protein
MEDERGPLVGDAYAPLRRILKGGFRFTLLELLHAIGVKTCPFPQTQVEAVSNAWLFSKLLYGDGGFLRIRRIASDLHAIRSQELGIGVMCILVNRLWNVPFEGLEAIRGRGMRFDYRAQTPHLLGIFEAKGTASRGRQGQQIANGLAKKRAHHDRGEHFDLELIVSTAVSRRERPRIVVADPELTDWESAFGEFSEKEYRLRHFARVSAFAGARLLGRQLKKNADMPWASTPLTLRRHPGNEVEREIEQLEETDVEGRTFAGRWVERWLPKTDRPGGKRTAYEEAVSGFTPGLRVFQGCERSVLGRLLRGDWETQIGVAPFQSRERLVPGSGEIASIFEDGSILAARVA